MLARLLVPLLANMPAGNRRDRWPQQVVRGKPPGEIAIGAARAVGSAVPLRPQPTEKKSPDTFLSGVIVAKVGDFLARDVFGRSMSQRRYGPDYPR